VAKIKIQEVPTINGVKNFPEMYMVKMSKS
jgi:hypothetical protein